MSTTTATEAYYSIRQMLWTGDLAPGQRVSQSRIARFLQCSTVPVVEALRRLESERLLTKEPRKMARVRLLQASEIEGLFLVRQSLEMVATRLCAQRRDSSLLATLADFDLRFQRAAQQQDSLADQLDVEFHLAIARGACCPVLEEELGRLLLIQRTAPARPRNADDWERYAASHLGLVQAISDGDLELSELLMKKHIQSIYNESVLRAGLVRPGDAPTNHNAISCSIEPQAAEDEAPKDKDNQLPGKTRYSPF